jgi:hypothetical protein
MFRYMFSNFTLSLVALHLWIFFRFFSFVLYVCYFPKRNELFQASANTIYAPMFLHRMEKEATRLDVVLAIRGYVSGYLPLCITNLLACLHT